MKRRSLLSAALALSLFSLPAAATAAGKRIAVVYFSQRRNIGARKPLPAAIDAYTGASLPEPGLVGLLSLWAGEAFNVTPAAIQTAKPYPAVFQDCLDRVLEEKRTNARPELTPETLKTAASLKNADLIFLGFPNWSYTLPLAVVNFLEKADLKGKTIAPFCVHGTGGLAGTLDALAKAAPEARILPAFHVPREEVAASRAEFSAWAKRSAGL